MIKKLWKITMTLNKFITNFFPNVDLGSYTEYQHEKKFQSPSYNSFNQLLSWPPNIFLILHSIIEYTDKYRILVSPQDHLSWENDKNDTCETLVKFWINNLNNLLLNKDFFITLNNPLKNHLDRVFNKLNFEKCIYDLMNDNTFCSSVFILTISIDKLFSKKLKNNSYLIINDLLIKRKISYNIKNRLEKKNIESTLINLADNDSKYGIITRKYNTPQSGLTLNNLTQNLTFIKPTVRYTHNINKFDKNKHIEKNYNILVIPWPFEVKDEYFSPSHTKNNHMNDYFDFFDYNPKDNFNIRDFLSFILSAVKRVGVIDLIVFPECSLSENQFNSFKQKLYEIFNKNAPAILSGVYGKDAEHGKNSAVLGFIDETLRFNTIIQEKHHRWFLDRNQLRNYNLSTSLNPGKKWWENIAIRRRKLTTLETANGVILCPLVCEDLARQEPVAQAVRAIGPNLVISLLLDGPQIAPRWPGKYAAVLSDDPGSSVLSVTALGMTQRATGLGHEPSKDIALWSEPGKPSETLQVSSKSGALLIELELESTKMWSLDGQFEEKSVLRKKMHTTFDLEFKNISSNELQRTLVNTLRTGGNYVQ